MTANSRRSTAGRFSFSRRSPAMESGRSIRARIRAGRERNRGARWARFCSAELICCALAAEADDLNARGLRLVDHGRQIGLSGNRALRTSLLDTRGHGALEDRLPGLRVVGGHHAFGGLGDFDHPIDLRPMQRLNDSTRPTHSDLIDRCGCAQSEVQGLGVDGGGVEFAQLGSPVGADRDPRSKSVAMADRAAQPHDDPMPLLTRQVFVEGSAPPGSE